MWASGALRALTSWLYNVGEAGCGLVCVCECARVWWKGMFTGLLRVIGVFGSCITRGAYLCCVSVIRFCVEGTEWVRDGLGAGECALSSGSSGCLFVSLIWFDAGGECRSNAFRVTLIFRWVL